jgi:hypothetical protein
MKTRSIGIGGLVLALAMMIPVLFFLSRGAVGTNQTILIVLGVLMLVLWTIPYITLVDPWLRRRVGALLGVTIELRGGGSSVKAWAISEKAGCLLGNCLELLGYLFMLVWYVPFAVAIALAWWFRH